MCLTKILKSFAPISLLASTNGLAEIAIVPLRATRKKCGEYTIAIAITAFFKLGPRIPAIAIANSSAGRENIISINRPSI